MEELGKEERKGCVPILGEACPAFLQGADDWRQQDVCDWETEGTQTDGQEGER